MSDYLRELLDKIINSDYLLFKEPASQSNFPEPFLSTDLSSRKRTVQDFLAVYNKKKPRKMSIINIEDNIEEELIDNVDALLKLQFPIDPLFRKHLKSHQVRSVMFFFKKNNLHFY